MSGQNYVNPYGVLLSGATYVNADGISLSTSTTPTSPITSIWAAYDPGVVTTASEPGHTLDGDSGDDEFVIFAATDAVVIPTTKHGIDTVSDCAWDTSYTLPAGIDNLLVNGGAQIASGNAQDNLIMTGSGTATVSGGGGDDVFVLGTGADTVVDPQGSGSDVIYDFNASIDDVRLDGGTQFATWSSVQSALTQVGSDVVLNMGGGQTLTFRNETVSDFSASNFSLPIDTAALSLTFDDEFNTFVSSPDGSSGWMTSWPYSGISDRSFPSMNSYFSDSSVGVNPFKDVNGVLDLTASVAPAGSNPDNLPYNTGTMTTYKSEAQLYGYFEIRCELPAGQGLWPSFYMESYDNSAELDIFEILGRTPNVDYTTAIDWTTKTSTTAGTIVPDSSTGFHTYGVDWEPDTVTFYMDGHVIFTAATPATMHIPMYMMAEMAVGVPGSWAEAPSSNSIFPATMQIDYVRAYATAATQDVGGTAAIAQPIGVQSATTAVATTDNASAEPFSGVVITDANAALTETAADPNATQTETATVTLSSLLNGSLSDPNAATDGSTIAGGVWTMSGPSTAVAAALDGLVFTPTAHEVAPGGTVTTTVTAVITDAGETASTTSTITATAVAVPIAVTPATAAVATTDAASASPFTGVAITDANAGQTETATVTLSAAANGTLSDPNVLTDGSTVVGGVWTVSGSATAVASALDGLVFTPTAHEVAPNASVSTSVTAAITDTAGETASATSAITATAVAAPITVTPATANVTTTASASVKPFNSVVIGDANAGQTETATVTLSSAVNGTLSDPNAATDGSTAVAGVWSVSGSSAAVAAALDGLVFTPNATAAVSTGAASTGAASTGAVTTTLTATIKDTAGETASTTAAVVATPPAAPAIDTLTLQIAEDAWKGDAKFTVHVNGTQVGGTYTASTLHSSGDSETFLLTGNWNSGVNDVEVSFLNDAYGGAPTMDRNLIVSSLAYNGVTDAGTYAVMGRAGSHSFVVGGSTPTAVAPADKLTLNLSEDAYQGDAQFVLYIDGRPVTTPQVVTALHEANATEAFSFAGNWRAGTHTIGVDFVNPAAGGTATTDRNLYVNGVTVNGSDIYSGCKALTSAGTCNFMVHTNH